jgi:hypothetical protein
VLTYGRPRAVEARDEAGRSLLPASHASSAFSPIGSGNPMLLLQPPPVRGGKLERLKFVLPVEVMARRREMLTVPDFFQAAGKTYSGEGAVRIKLTSIQRVNPTFLQVQFSLSAPSRARLDARSLGLRLSDARGEEQLSAFLTMNGLSDDVRELEAEDLRVLSGSPLGGFPSQLPWAALAPGALGKTRREWSWSAQFSTREPIGSSVKLTLFHFDRLRTELPFELRDLRLP